MIRAASKYEVIVASCFSTSGRFVWLTLLPHHPAFWGYYVNNEVKCSPVGKICPQLSTFFYLFWFQRFVVKSTQQEKIRLSSPGLSQGRRCWVWVPHGIMGSQTDVFVFLCETVWNGGADGLFSSSYLPFSYTLECWVMNHVTVMAVMLPAVNSSSFL